MSKFFTFLVEDYGYSLELKDWHGYRKSCYSNDVVEVTVGPFLPRDPVEVGMRMFRTEYSINPYVVALHYEIDRFRSWVTRYSPSSLEDLLRYNSEVLKRHGRKLLLGDRKAWFEVDQLNRKFYKGRIHTELYKALNRKIVFQ